METKPFWKSLTVWTAVIQALIGVLTAIAAQDPSVKVVGVIAILKSFVDLANRVRTTQPII